MALDPKAVRAQFPALNRPDVFFDNPGGTQIARPALDGMNRYLLENNSNHEGVFATSIASDATLAAAHQAMADFLNAARPDEIIFGANMTTLTLHISRSLARLWRPGDAIVVTRLDHDANVTPWVLAAQDRGCDILWVDFNPLDGTLNPDDLRAALDRKPRLLAVGYASNSLGTINPLQQIIPWAHAAGALVYVDAVHYAPHGAIDVQQLGCDFLVCSSYKFFGPHGGVLYGRHALLEELFAYKVRPAPNTAPGKFETGTQNHECIAGVLGTIEYYEWLGRQFGEQYGPSLSRAGYTGRRLVIKQAQAAIHDYERELCRAMLGTLAAVPRLKVYGLTDRALLEERVATFSFRLPDLSPKATALKLAEAGLYAWSGNYYAINTTERLGLEATGGMVRVGAVHYNTLEEVDRLGQTLRRLSTP
jgi:cysteine desulfurase family protein (TIGR01976 family)